MCSKVFKFRADFYSYVCVLWSADSVESVCLVRSVINRSLMTLVYHVNGDDIAGVWST